MKKVSLFLAAAALCLVSATAQAGPFGYFVFAPRVYAAPAYVAAPAVTYQTVTTPTFQVNPFVTTYPAFSASFFGPRYYYPLYQTPLSAATVQPPLAADPGVTMKSQVDALGKLLDQETRIKALETAAKKP